MTKEEKEEFEKFKFDFLYGIPSEESQRISDEFSADMIKLRVEALKAVGELERGLYANRIRARHFCCLALLAELALTLVVSAVVLYFF